MSDNQKNQDYGQQFKSELEQALGTGDFTNLNQLVKDTVAMSVSGVADTVAKGAQALQEAVQMPQDAKPPDPSGSSQKAKPPDGTQPEARRNLTQERIRQMEAEKQRAREKAAQNRKDAANDSRGSNLTPALYKKSGTVAGTLCEVFGGIGIGVSGIALLIFLSLFLASRWGAFGVVTVLFASLMSCSGVIFGLGVNLKGRLKRAERYFRLSETTGYVNIKELAQAVGKKEKQVIKDLKDLIAGGVFPQGHLDREEKCFMLSDATYREYESVTQQRALIEENDRRAQLEMRRAEAEEASLTPEQKELRAMVAEGQDYIRQIREKNDAIPGEVISQKLYRMEELLKEIFANLEKMPQQRPKMHRLMSYYLPTTLKLVTAYEQFDQMSVQGEDVRSAKAEIENTIDTINDAYGELLNKLFSETAMDVTTDAQVLKTVLAREGLTQGGLEYVNELR